MICTSLVHTSTKYGNTANVCISCSWMSSHVLACLYICKVCIWVGVGIALQGLIPQVYHIMNETIHTILNSEAMSITRKQTTCLCKKICSLSMRAAFGVFAEKYGFVVFRLSLFFGFCGFSLFFVFSAFVCEASRKGPPGEFDETNA